jgi:hypothetical protein
MAIVLRILFFISISLFSLLSEAFYFMTPQGQREAMMGNVGIALSGSEGSVLFNPAGVAGLESDRISASGSLLNVSTFKINYGADSFSDKSTEPSFSQIPGLITGYNKTSFAILGFYINTDYFINFDKLFTYNGPTYTAYSESISNLNSLNLGLVAAKTTYLSKDMKLQYGISLGVNLLESHNSSFNKSVVTAGNTYTSTFENTNIKTTNFTGQIGLQLLTPSFSIGTTFRPRGGRISSSYSKFAYSVSTSGTIEDRSSNTGEALDTPIRYGLGIGTNIFKATKLLIDADAIEGLEKNKDSSDPLSGRTNSVGMGIEQVLESGNHIFAGLRNSKIKTDTTQEVWLASAGFEYKMNFIKNYFGGYVSEYSSKSSDDPSRITSFSFINAGLIIATQYAF